MIDRVHCISCGIEDASGDNRIIFDNGTYKCFACGDHGKDQMITNQPNKKSSELPILPDNGNYQAIPSRGISKETCELLGIFQTKLYDQDVIVFPYGSKCQKVRFKDKKFLTLGSRDNIPPFGANVWSTSASNLVICEGEFDAAHLKTIMDSNYNITTMGGAGDIENFIKCNYTQIVKHEKIILCMDKDKAGEEALQKALDKLPKARTMICTLSEKDPCEMFAKGKQEDTKWAIRKAKPQLHGSVVNAGDLKKSDLYTTIKSGVDIPFPLWNKYQRGWRPKELTMLTSFTGSGKTTILRTLLYDLVQKGKTVAGLFLEEDIYDSTYFYFLGMEYNIDPLKLMDREIELSEEQINKFADKYRDRLYLTKDEFGGIGSTSLHDMLEYFAVVLQVDFIFFDHITIAVMGSEGFDKVSEMNRTVTKIRELVHQSSVHIVCVSHLRKPGKEQKGFEAGRRIGRNEMTGSAVLSQVCDNMVSINGNLLNEHDKNVRVIILHKCRKGRVQEQICDSYDFDPDNTRILI